VTGAVSRVGRALCAELLRRGAVLYMGDVSDTALSQMADEFNRAYPGRAFSVPTDASQAYDAQHLADVALQRKGRLDCLMMAETAPCSVPIGQVMAESWRYAIDVNLMGVVNMVEAVLPQMRVQGHGRIALLMPLSGLLPAPFESVCSATHAAARALMESLRYELWDEKIQCMSACLDGVFSQGFEMSEDKPAEAAVAAVLKGIAENVPVVIWPESAMRQVEACGPSTDERQQCLIKDARQRKAGIRTKGAYM
jgi:NADP-dependent 3-hydroxy acid dehydrogenase YdfG